MVFSDVFRQKKSTQESGQTWGSQVCRQKRRYGTITGPWREKSEICSFSLHSKGKPKKSEILPLRDRYWTVTGPWQPHSETANSLCCAQSRPLQVASGFGVAARSQNSGDMSGRDPKTAAASWRQWRFDKDLSPYFKFYRSIILYLYFMFYMVYAAGSPASLYRARKDWLQYVMGPSAWVGNGPFYGGPARLDDLMRTYANIMLLPLQPKANETFVCSASVTLMLSNVW